MIGDLRLFIERFFKQQIICKHDYKTVWIKHLQNDSYDECAKCGKVR